MRQFREWLLAQVNGKAQQPDVAAGLAELDARMEKFNQLQSAYGQAQHAMASPHAHTGPAFTTPPPKHLRHRSYAAPAQSEMQHRLIDWDSGADLKQGMKKDGSLEAAHLWPLPPPTPLVSHPTRPLGPRFRDALDGQVNHLMLPCWTPSSRSYGVPLSNREYVPHVVRLFTAFMDTRTVCDDEHAQTSAAHFQSGGIWTQDVADVESICWNLVEATVSLHTVGAVGLLYRRCPQNRPDPSSMDAKITFGQRIFLVELLVKHYKSIAHRMMLQKDVEEHLVFAHSYLFGTLKFGQKLAGISTQMRTAMHHEFSRRGMPSNMGATSTTNSDKNANGHSVKRPLSATSVSAKQGSPKRANLGQPSPTSKAVKGVDQTSEPSSHTTAPCPRPTYHRQWSGATPEHSAGQDKPAQDNTTDALNKRDGPNPVEDPMLILRDVMEERARASPSTRADAGKHSEAKPSVEASREGSEEFDILNYIHDTEGDEVDLAQF
ncbi:hypothetical protein N0V90_005077 [Kalmusia sp. IMI 367209]|nr:hypothetical protein N0V90_005077 [Kalmusia sp. IMI 367209]